MPDFEWTDEMTEFSLRNLEHATWGASNPGDMLRIIDRYQNNGGKVSEEEKDAISGDIGVQGNDVFQFLRHLKLITKNNLELTTAPESGDRPGFYTGQSLGGVIKDLGADAPAAMHILGHNFILHAREGLAFCNRLSSPGIEKSVLRDELLDHYVFNQKLNSFKFDNLPKLLMQFRLIRKGDYGFENDHAPPALTFYQIAASYFFLSQGRVNHKVDAGLLLSEVDNIIPNRNEDYSVLGFENFPIEGWGRHQAWMTSESFSKMLEIGLIEPKTTATILLEKAKDDTMNSRDLAKVVANRIKDRLLEIIELFKDPKPIGYEEVVSELDQVNNTQ